MRHNLARLSEVRCDPNDIEIQRTLMKAFVQHIIDSLTKLEASGEHHFSADFQIYFRNAISQLDNYDIDQPKGIEELAAFMKHIEQVASALLTLIEQTKLAASVERLH